eukprot:TRINITY_DN16085_c0_g1_i2.p2 TRINITY_DN16085_c0_g1~~TRINITY_DN16085_c0_g1_i2.p2  ORF type:complete len:206 (-),score=49.74 TRINITY_DN16085_c0_g1_i2:81-698(-)
MAAATEGYPAGQVDQRSSDRGSVPGPHIGSDREPRFVAESVLLLLHAEIARNFRRRLGAEAATAALQDLGFASGRRLVAQLASTRFPLVAERNVMKFVCKELWVHFFRKPASRLQTDQKGNYIIHDAAFRWLEHFSPSDGSSAQLDEELQQAASLHLAMPCGIIRGGLLALGITSSVRADVSAASLPACSFTVTLGGLQDSTEAL